MTVALYTQMGSRLGLLDFDQLFHATADATIVPVGVRVSGKAALDEYIQLLFRKSSDLTFAARCSCGELTGTFYQGTTCPRCRTSVTSTFSSDLYYKSWLHIPESLPPVLHPGLYKVLNEYFGRVGTSSLMKALLNRDSTLPAQLRGVMGTGMTHFYENFDDIMNYLLYRYKRPTSQKKPKSVDDVVQMLETYKHCRFVRFLPIANNAFHVVDEVGSMRYTDSSSGPIVQATIELGTVQHILKNTAHSQKMIDQHMFTMYQSYLEYVDEVSGGKLCRKPGFIRKRIMGGRIHNSFRAVISPITGEHMGDEVHVPWHVGITNLKLEILNILMHRKHYSLPEALALHNRAVTSYVEEIDQCLRTLIDECRFKGLPILFGRNPNIDVLSGGPWLRGDHYEKHKAS